MYSDTVARRHGCGGDEGAVVVVNGRVMVMFIHPSTTLSTRNAEACRP